MLQMAQDDDLHNRLHEKSLQRAEQLSIENMTHEYRAAFLAEMDG
jgi:hypothetical protein